MGGLGRPVKGRTVAVKINLTGSPIHRLRNRPAELAHWVHPRVIGAVTHLMDRAGARRIRILESAARTAGPLEEFLYRAGWDPGVILGAGSRVELVNTNWIGNAREYPRFDVPGCGLLFRARSRWPACRSATPAATSLPWSAAATRAVPPKPQPDPLRSGTHGTCERDVPCDNL